MLPTQSSKFTIRTCTSIVTISLTRFARSTTSPSIAYVSNPAPDSSLHRAAAPRLRPLQLLLTACIRISCCMLPDCVRFNCSLIASASAAAPRLRPFHLQLPDCVRFDCCSPIASASCFERFQPMPNVLEHSSCSPRFGKSKYEGCAPL